MSASIDANVRLLRRVVPDPIEETPESEELGCEHDKLVFDDINDVSCKHCGKDFTG